MFSLFGAVIYFILNAVGLIESLGGFVAVYCAINGYVLFAKKESKKGIIISLIIATVVIILSWYLCFCLNTVEQINKNAESLPADLRNISSFWEFLPRSFEVIGDQPKVLLSLGLSLAFGVLGYLSYTFKLFTSDTPKSKHHGS